MNFQSKHWIIKPCKSFDGLMIVLKDINDKKLDLKNLLICLKKKDYKSEYFSDLMVIVKKNNKEISIFSDGKIIVKNVKNDDIVKKLLEDIYSCLS